MRKETRIVVVPVKNPKARDCQQQVVEQFRKDLAAYEADYKIKLKKDEDGEYETLSWHLNELDALLYSGNPKSPYRLEEAVMPELFGIQGKDIQSQGEIKEKYEKRLAQAQEVMDIAKGDMEIQLMSERIRLLSEIVSDLEKIKEPEEPQAQEVSFRAVLEQRQKTAEYLPTSEEDKRNKIACFSVPERQCLWPGLYHTVYRPGPVQKPYLKPL